MTQVPRSTPGNGAFLLNNQIEKSLPSLTLMEGLPPWHGLRAFPVHLPASSHVPQHWQPLAAVLLDSGDAIASAREALLPFLSWLSPADL